MILLMRIIADGDKLSIFALKKDDIDMDNINEYIKKLVLKLKRKYRRDISGFYDAFVYTNDKMGIIIDLVREEELDFFRDLVDLKIKVYSNSDIYLEFGDYFLLDKKNIYFWKDNYYVDLKDISDEEFLNIIEFSRVVYGDELEGLKKNLSLVVRS